MWSYKNNVIAEQMNLAADAAVAGQCNINLDIKV